MLWLWITLIVLFVLLIGLLLMPVCMRVDTSINQYEIEIPGLFRAAIVPHEEDIIQIKMRILFFNKTIRPFDLKPGKKENRKNKEERRKKKRNIGKGRSGRESLRLAWKMLKSFKVNYLYVNIDTNDAIWNAFLIPVFHFFSGPGKVWKINWHEEQLVRFEIENRPIRVLWAFVKP